MDSLTQGAFLSHTRRRKGWAGARMSDLKYLMHFCGTICRDPSNSYQFPTEAQVAVMSMEIFTGNFHTPVAVISCIESCQPFKQNDLL